MRIIGYHVFNATNGLWLAGDEHSWGDFDEAVSFNDADLAKDIGDREAGENDTIHVMGLLK